MKATSQKCFGAALWQGQSEKVLFQETLGEGSSGADGAVVARCGPPSEEVIL